MQWAADYYDRFGRSTDAPRLYTHDLDLDHDGSPELFVWSHWHMGQASGAYVVFERVGAQYRFIGDIAMGLYRALPLGPDGLPRLAVYTRRTGTEGDITIYTNDGMDFTVVSSEVINSDDGVEAMDPGDRRFRELFGQDAFHCGREYVLSDD